MSCYQCIHCKVQGKQTITRRVFTFTCEQHDMQSDAPQKLEKQYVKDTGLKTCVFIRKAAK